MSVLTILCLASLAIFSLADPIPTSDSTEADVASNAAQIEALVAAINAVINEQLAPLLADLQEADQLYLKDITSEACKEAMNYATNAFVRRDAPSTEKSNVLASFQKNMDQFRHCLDQSLAMAVGDVNENQLKPVFNVLGDSINRFSKAFEDLTATTKRPDPDLDF